ncbi:MAG: hypothetical protein Q8R39_04770 [bacterium]|nr:hypothetical protein [bacterium]MDZ4284238.1 hypothetical protein [Patescibacteria group bacterium]
MNKGALPTITLSAAPTSIAPGEFSSLSWSTTNATSCTASGGWTGARALSGGEVVNPTTTKTYTLSCTGTGGTTSKTATVTVM